MDIDSFEHAVRPHLEAIKVWVEQMPVNNLPDVTGAGERRRSLLSHIEGMEKDIDKLVDDDFIFHDEAEASFGR